jgi:hypothetical protein
MSRMPGCAELFDLCRSQLLASIDDGLDRWRDRLRRRGWDGATKQAKRHDSIVPRRRSPRNEPIVVGLGRSGNVRKENPSRRRPGQWTEIGAGAKPRLWLTR